MEFLNKIFNANERKLSDLAPTIEQINALEPQMKKLSLEEFAQKTSDWKSKVDTESLDEILPEAYALVREAFRRTLGERTFDEQLMVSILLHQGKVAEQKTGEGKTHAAVHPLYLNSLTGRGAHLVTVNEYLARRDAEWMGPIYGMLGVSVGVINPNQQSYLFDYDKWEEENAELRKIDDSAELRRKIKSFNLGHGDYLKKASKREAYGADVTYGTNNEVGFDYLRDNMVQRLDQMVQINPKGEFGAHHFVIVDEVDSILIDEARTPLIISAPAEESNELYQHFAKLVKKLNPEDLERDEKAKSAFLTDLGVKKIESWLKVENIYEDFTLAHHLQQALNAEYMFKKDTDYVVKDNEVLIVDEFTGRLMEGRRYSEGLHQAIEAKEGVPIQKESKTVATITFQNYFRMYDKLAGMGATIMTEAEEFHKIYQLDSLAVPTHEPVIRKDHPDRVYKHQRAKWKAIADEIKQISTKGRPILVGTTSVEKNELVHQLLSRRGIPHEVLNAKNHAREAEIVAKAGEQGSVTVATNMAGRGTDIKLGDGVVELGGLYVVGTERHEARRIDNQLRGRSGRQGDPGSSRFFVALDDDLMRIFGGDRIANLMTRFDLPEDIPIEHGLVSRSIENAQEKVEGHNFDIRKRLVEYDDVINRQREIIYARRRKLLESSDPASRSHLSSSLSSLLLEKAAKHSGNYESFQRDLESKKSTLNEEKLEELIRQTMLSTLDHLWMEHIDALDELRVGVGLRGYGQRDPLVEFKNEAYGMFERLIEDIDIKTVNRFQRIQVAKPQKIKIEMEDVLQQAQARHQRVGQFQRNSKPLGSRTATVVASGETYEKPEKEDLGRNDPCWCGSGKKYKKCHGK